MRSPSEPSAKAPGATRRCAWRRDWETGRFGWDGGLSSVGIDRRAIREGPCLTAHPFDSAVCLLGIAGEEGRAPVHHPRRSARRSDPTAPHRPRSRRAPTTAPPPALSERGYRRQSARTTDAVSIPVAEVADLGRSTHDCLLLPRSTSAATTAPHPALNERGYNRSAPRAQRAPLQLLRPRARRAQLQPLRPPRSASAATDGNPLAPPREIHLLNARNITPQPSAWRRRWLRGWEG